MNLRTFISASMLVTVGMISGRILGMVREMMMAAHFGTGHHGDTAILLLMIPDFVTTAFIGSAISSALVPAFAARTPERAVALLWQSLALSVGVFSLLLLLLSSQLPFLLTQLQTADAPSIGGPLRISLSAIPIAMATAVLTAYLQHRGRFLAPAFATVTFNVVIILTLWLGTDDLRFLAMGIFAASAVRFLPHFVGFVRSKAKPFFAFAPREFDRHLVKIYALSTGSGIFGLLPIYAPYAIVAAVGDSIATFNYAFKLVLLPGMLCQTIVQLVLLPWLVAHRNNAPEGEAPVSMVLQIAWLVSFSMALCLSLAAHPIAALFFSYGKMTPDDIARIGSLFSIGVWALPAMVLLSVWQVIFYSRQRAFAPLAANMLQAALIIPLCWIAHRFAGLQGVLVAIIAVQAICVGVLAVLGYRSGLSQRLVPGWRYFTMTFAMGLVSLPFVYFFLTMLLAAWSGFALAAFAGVVILSAGAATSPVLRHHFTTWVTRENHPDHQRS